MTLKKTTLAAVACLAAVCFAPDARAQELLTIDISPSNSAAVGRQMCLDGGSTSVTYNVLQDLILDTSVKLTLYLTKSRSCPDEPPSDAEVLIPKTIINSNNLTGLRQVSATLLGGTDCPSDVEVKWLACAVVFQSVTNATGTGFVDSAVAQDQIELSYDSKAPAAPVLTSAEGGDSTVIVSWTASEDAGDWRIFYRPIGPAPAIIDDECGVAGPADASEPGLDASEPESSPTEQGPAQAEPDPDPTDPDPDPTDPDPDPTEPDPDPTDPEPSGVDLTGWSSITINDGTLRKGTINRLVNGQEYEVLVIARDPADNESPQSNVLTATPKNVQDFYERYRCQGGSETGGFGCSASGMGLVPLAGFAALALRRRAGRRQE